MSFATVGQCVDDEAFQKRVQSCIAKEQVSRGDPVDPFVMFASMIWAVSAAADVEAAYASALAGGNPNPGGDEAVITDGMILSNVQAHWPGQG